MSFFWQQMSVAEYAALEQRLDSRVLRVGEHYLRKVRPFFYRPILPFLEYPSSVMQGPWQAAFGGFQHAVPPGVAANSHLNLLMFDRVESYSLNDLNYNQKRQVRLASKRFEIRPMRDVAELKAKGHPVYLSFYERTRYAYKAERRIERNFANWVEVLLGEPKNIVLGAFREGALGAVSVSQWVGDVVLYSTFFSTSESLRLHVSDLMLHTVRAGAEKCSGVKWVFVGMFKDEKGLNDFYQLRGAQLVRKPASLQLNPVIKLLLKGFAPTRFAKMRGELPQDAILPEIADPQHEMSTFATLHQSPVAKRK